MQTIVTLIDACENTKAEALRYLYMESSEEELKGSLSLLKLSILILEKELAKK